MRRTLLSLISLLAAVSIGWSVGAVTATAESEYAGVAFPHTDEAMTAYLDAADYEPLLPELRADEAWHLIVHHVPLPSMTQGDLWLQSDLGLVHIWESDVPSSLLGAADPVGQGIVQEINGDQWWEVARERPNGPWLALSMRTPTGLAVSVDGDPAAVRAIVERLQ